MIGFPLGLVYANAMEWVIHKHMLHGLGRNKQSFWSFHWHEHHNRARQHKMHDEVYEGRLTLEWNARTKEIVALLGGALVHAPLFPVAPFFTLAVWASAANYYRVHRRAHLDQEWANAHLPWHVDHHMGPNQDANWCVSFPLWDHVMKTRERYLGTQKHRDDLERERARAPMSLAPPETRAAA
jgi:sterol desaturase/sphingolipid hydroxylase (fatty acid hydroxylase superfamily)